MKENFKKNVGNFVIYIGKHAVGKCLSPGFFEPKIPDLFKENKNERQKANIYQGNKHNNLK